jgi:hypothetical protein
MLKIACQGIRGNSKVITLGNSRVAPHLTMVDDIGDDVAADSIRVAPVRDWQSRLLSPRFSEVLPRSGLRHRKVFINES